MLRSTALALLASTALLGIAGCSMEKVDHGGQQQAAAAAVADPTSGQELHVLFEAEKRNAESSELPPQF